VVRTSRKEQTVIKSKDGTTLAVDRVGKGPAVVCVGGALNDRHSTAAVAQHMPDFEVYSYDRRGRGDSAVPPFDVGAAVSAEIEDLAAVIEEAGGEAMVYGMSSGAVLALRAALAGLPITRLALYEPPFTGEVEDAPPPPPSYADRLATSTPAEALELFLTGIVQFPTEALPAMRESPMWRSMESLAPTLRYDAAVMADNKIPPVTALSVPVTVLVGGASPAWMKKAAQTLATHLPTATVTTLPNQTHDVDPAVLAAALTKAFA
jgi:pimeloyl-ACP methyl ester carboxylesterase